MVIPMIPIAIIETSVNPEEGVVLASPELIRIDTSMKEPGLARIPLDYPYSFQMLRYGHRTVPVGFDPLMIQGNQSRAILIAGGSLQPLNFDPDRPNRILYELPRREEDIPLFINRTPDGTESADALIFEEREEEVAQEEGVEDVDVGLEALANKYGWSKVLDAVDRMSKK